MPYYKEKDTGVINKAWYSVSEVAEICDVNSSAIRFWDTEWKEIVGLVKRNKKFNRRYTPEQVETFKMIALWSKTPVSEKFGIFKAHMNSLIDFGIKP